jgi:hypothetical protein
VPAYPEEVSGAVRKATAGCKDKALSERAGAVLKQADAAIRERKASSDETGFSPMLNGKDLSGWDGKGAWWKVVDGVLTGETTPDNPCKKSAYLLWTGGRGRFRVAHGVPFEPGRQLGHPIPRGHRTGASFGAYRFDPKAAGYQATCRATARLLVSFGILPCS